MAARRSSPPSDGAAFAVILGGLFVVGLVMTYIWWFVGGAVLAGLFVAGRAFVRRMAEQRARDAELAAEREFALQRSAERPRLFRRD